MNNFDNPSSDHSKEFIDDTSKSDVSVANMAHFSSTDTTTASELVTVIYRRETQSTFISSDATSESMSEQEHFSASSEIYSLNSLTNTSPENLQFSIVSADDELGFSKDVTIDCSSQESTDLKPVINTNTEDRQFPIASADDGLVCLKDVIIHSSSQKSTYSSESTAFNTRNLKALLCRSIESLQLLSDIDSQGTSIVQRNDKLSKTMANKSSELNLSIVQPDSSANSSLVKLSSSDSKSFEVTSLKVSSTSNYNETLKLLYLKKEELIKIFTERKMWQCNTVKLLKILVMGLKIAFNSPAIRKSKRNVCIQSIYYRILYEVIECVGKMVAEMNNTLKYIQENYEIQQRKVIELLEKFDTNESEHKIDFIDESLKDLVEKSIINLKRLDSLAARRINDIDLLLVNNTKKFKNLSKLF